MSDAISDTDLLQQLVNARGVHDGIPTAYERLGRTRFKAAASHWAERGNSAQEVAQRRADARSGQYDAINYGQEDPIR